ncbi:Methylosome protein 50 [Phytophthora palmivora]|uniref:Methylosome protein 50 n=1 Tax=Phytophthora palmivora TaxID=4796 RepID=A0A2P4YQR5_9STRA|nr:Methylosome protein 50 [Phytophthora palmivora]
MWRTVAQSQPQLKRIVWNGGVGLVGAAACEGLCELELETGPCSSLSLLSMVRGVELCTEVSPHGFDLGRGDELRTSSFAILSISGYDGAALVGSTLVPALSVDWHHKQPTVLSVELEDQMIRTYDVCSPHTPLARRETHRAAAHVVKYSPYRDVLLATGGDDGKAYVTVGSFSSDRTASSGIDELLVGEENTAPHRDYV